MGQVRNAIFIQALNAFVIGILAILLPLLMLERNIDIVSIGLIYASLPMIFQLTRMGFAVISDFIGRKIFFILNGILSIFSILIYYFSYSPLEFLFGKITEGATQASLWSVNRAFILEHSKKKWKALVQMRTFSYIFEALGTLIAGFLIVLFFYTNILIFCILISVLIIPGAFAIADKKIRKFRIEKAFTYLDFRRKDVIFKKTLLLFLTLGLSFGFITGYIFPLFLKENGLSPEAIGTLLGIQALLTSSSMYFFTKEIRLEKVILYGGLFYSFILFLLGFSSFVFAAFLIVIFGIPQGIIHSGIEGIFSKVTKNETYGTDIGLLMMGLHTGRTISLALSGLLISLYGFSFIFSLSVLIFSVFFIYAYSIFKK